SQQHRLPEHTDSLGHGYLSAFHQLESVRAQAGRSCGRTLQRSQHDRAGDRRRPNRARDLWRKWDQPVPPAWLSEPKVSAMEFLPREKIRFYVAAFGGLQRIEGQPSAADPIHSPRSEERRGGKD